MKYEPSRMELARMIGHAIDRGDLDLAWRQLRVLLRRTGWLSRTNRPVYQSERAERCGYLLARERARRRAPDVSA